MTTDTKIREAIEAAVTKVGQDRTLATKLVRWFEAIASGNEDINDSDLTDRHLERLYEATRTGTALGEAAAEDEAALLDHDEKAY